MIGTVDDKGRALIEIAVRSKLEAAAETVTTWIDTAFDGHLVFPRRVIERLQLESLAETEAVLADGSSVTLDTFLVYVDWFGRRAPILVIANEGIFPLLGTGLLDHHVLHIDYASRQLTLD